MLGLETQNYISVASGAPPPVRPSQPNEPRSVEAAGKDEDNEAVPEKSYSPSRAVLQLLRRSAEAFSEILTATGSPALASAASGTPLPSAALGHHVDTFA